MIIPYSTSWDYEGITTAWYFVIAIKFTSTHTMQYWLGMTSANIYTRVTTDSGATWTVATLH